MATKTKKPIAPKKTVANYGSFGQKPNAKKLTREYLEAMTKRVKRDGENDSHLNDFLWISDALINSCEGGILFSFQDALIFARHLQTDFEDLKRLYDGWTTFLQSQNCISSVETCYDVPQFKFN